MLGDGLDRDGRGDLAGGVAAHAVGHAEERRLHEVGVLVVRAHAAHVGARAPHEVDGGAGVVGRVGVDAVLGDRLEALRRAGVGEARLDLVDVDFCRGRGPIRARRALLMPERPYRRPRSRAHRGAETPGARPVRRQRNPPRGRAGRPRARPTRARGSGARQRARPRGGSSASSLNRGARCGVGADGRAVGVERHLGVMELLGRHRRFTFMTTSPIWTSSPSRSVAGSTSGRPLTSVPLSEFKSLDDERRALQGEARMARRDEGLVDADV